MRSKSLKSMNRRLALSMAVVVLPGLLISGLGILAVSQQKKAKELKRIEEYENALVKIRATIETDIDAALEKTFSNIPASAETFQSGDSASVITAIKQILLDNPIVKYPFIIDGDGGFLFPLSPGSQRRQNHKGNSTGKKNTEKKKHHENMFSRYAEKLNGTGFRPMYQQAEKYEFKERKLSDAILFYTKCLEKIEKGPLKSSVTPYVHFAIARCYLKLDRFAQAVNYLEGIDINYRAQLKKDLVFYLNFLYQLAHTYKRMNLRSRAVSLFLQLYDEILKYESAEKEANHSFSFFKNQALEYLNSHITKDGSGFESPDHVRLREAISGLSHLDIQLRWQFQAPTSGERQYDYDIAPTGETDRFTFDRIREFYLPADEKVLFYKAVKESKLWRTPASTQLPGNEKSGVPFRMTNITLNPRSNIGVNFNDDAAKRSNINSACSVVYVSFPNTGTSDSPFYFGFMISREFITGHRIPELVSKIMRAEQIDVGEITVLAQEKGTAGDRNGKLNGETSRVGNKYSFQLKRLPFRKYLTSTDLILAATREDFFQSIVKKEMRINYVLIGAIVLMLVLGTGLFYKYITREAQLVRLKSEFVDSASHTLKTPLTRIRMMAEKLELGWINDENKTKEYLRSIVGETDRMAEMITNMLDFSKIESGKKTYKKKIASIAHHIERVLEQHRSHIRSLGFQLEVDLDKSVPPFNFDPDAVKVMLVNLMDNALKYSIEEKHMGVRLYKMGIEKVGSSKAVVKNKNEIDSVTNTQDKARYVVIEVWDRGMGIPPEAVENVFDKFYRVENDAVKVSEGSGLGLFLVRHAVDAHNGWVEVFSEPGKGSVFQVILPLVDDSNE